ncbi:MAG: SGNH/GDSL hydrolase family protein [Clostridia bacterium]|nr:SGNH/GDSL hydrolase family protein [Clostridia bacterium]
MKKIVLIGDSIRMGYDKYVLESLEESAEVYYPGENCKFAQYILRMLGGWKNKWPEDIDLVHWNAGLWDVIELYGDGPLTPIEYYAQMIKRVDKRLRLFFPNAKIIFATSTAVIEAGNTADHFRSNANIEAYNQAAIEALKDTDTIINDLYALTKDAPEEWHSDRTHYKTPAAIQAIGGQVVDVICKELEISAKEIDMTTFNPTHYSKDNIGF